LYFLVLIVLQMAPVHRVTQQTVNYLSGMCLCPSTVVHVKNSNLYLQNPSWPLFRTQLKSSAWNNFTYFGGNQESDHVKDVDGDGRWTV